MSDFEIMSLALNVISTLAVVVAAWLGVKNLRALVTSHADNHEWNRRIATQEALRAIRDLNIDDLNSEFGYSNQLTSIPLDTIKPKFDEKPELQMLCHKLLNFYEGLASGVNLGILDEITLKTNRRGAMERDFAKFRDYIQYRRDQVSPTLFIQMEVLITKWREEDLMKTNREQTGRI